MKSEQRTIFAVHPAAWGLILWALFEGQWWLLIAYASALIGHESAHAIAARWLGCKVSRMELTPFGAVIRIEDLTGKPMIYQGLIALAGPVASLVYALGGVISLRVVPSFLYQATVLSVKANLALLLFNLLPVLPLDGGRILFAMLAGPLGIQRTGRILSKAGVAAGMIMVLMSLYFAISQRVYHVTLLLAGCYLCYAAGQCAKGMAAHLIHTLILQRGRLEGERILPVRTIAVGAQLSVNQLFGYVTPGQTLMVHIIDPATMAQLGILDEKQILDALMTDGNLTVQEVLRLSNWQGK